MQTRGAHVSVTVVLLGLSAFLTMGACADGGPTSPDGVRSESPLISQRAIPGPGGLEGLMQDIAEFRAIAADPGGKTIAIGTTWGSNVSVADLVAHLESVALATKSNPAVAPGSVRLSTDYYDSFNVGGGSSIQIIPDGPHFKVKYWGYTECTYYGSTATAVVKGDLRASNSGGTWFLYNDASLNSSTQTTSGSYELSVTGGGNSYYMTGKHYCLPGFGDDRYFKTTDAYASH